MTTTPDRRRVLLGEDNHQLRRVLRFLLEEGGDIVVEATNGQEALDLAAHHTFDAIILDSQMPVLSGLEALPALRRAQPHTRIVMFTALASSTVRAQALAAGADDVIDKGGGLDALIAALSGGE